MYFAAKELAENSHVQDAFVIAVEQQAKERLERLSALRRIKPVDMTKLSQQVREKPHLDKLVKKHHFLLPQLCDASSPDNEENSQIYSAPVAELGSTTNLNQVQQQPTTTTTMSSATATFSSTSNEKNGNNAQLSTTTENVAKKKRVLPMENIESNVRAKVRLLLISKPTFFCLDGSRWLRNRRGIGALSDT